MNPAISGEPLQGRDAGTVFVAEMGDDDDVGRLSGLFQAHWEIEDERRSIDGPEYVSVEEAIDWGRARSDAVLVQVGYGVDGFYSAGAKDLTYDGSDDDEPEPIFPWPDGGLTVAARPAQSALDGSEQIVLWRAHLRLGLETASIREVLGRLTDDDLVVRVEEPSDPGDTADVIVRGCGVSAVYMPLYRLIERALLDEHVEPSNVLERLYMGSSDQRVID